MENNNNSNDKKNRVKINIAGIDFTVRSNENEHYTERIAARLNAEIRSVRSNSPNISLNNALMLAALNICDSMTRAEEDADHLRSQINEYLSDSAKYRSQYENIMLENEKLKKDIEIYKRRLNENSKKESAPVSASGRTARKVSSADEAAEEN